MIAKITRGSRSGDLAAYLHGPGEANEHEYDSQEGGAAIGGNLAREGDRDGAGWAADLRAAAKERPDIKNPIWPASLRSAPGDCTLSAAEWANAGSKFADKMWFANRPWVMVRYGEDHVHIAASRISETSEVRHGRNDFRQTQSAAQDIERDYGLQQAPRRREGRAKQPQGQEIASAMNPTAAERVAAARASSEVEPTRERREPMKNSAETSAADRVRAAREQADRDRDQGRER